MQVAGWRRGNRLLHGDRSPAHSGSSLEGVMRITEVRLLTIDNVRERCPYASPHYCRCVLRDLPGDGCHGGLGDGSRTSRKTLQRDVERRTEAKQALKGGFS